VATLILPADVSWGEGARPPRGPGHAAPADAARVAAIAQALREASAQGGRCALLLGGRALREPALREAGRIAAHLGLRLLGEVFPTRLTRGAGLPPVERLAYLAEMASVQLAGLTHLVLVDARPRSPSSPTPASPARSRRPAAPCTPWPRRTRTCWPA
jgi:acetolactate synthase-1/2/3 large subunit